MRFGQGAQGGDPSETIASEMTEPQPLEVLRPDAPSGDAALEDEEIEGQLALQNLKKRRAHKKRMRRIKIIVACLVVVGVIAVLFGRKLLAPDEQEEEYIPEMATVERRDFQNVISASGALKAGSTVVVTPEVDGIIESVLVSEGQSVEKDELLFTIKNDALDKAVRDAAQEVTSAEQAVASAQRGVSDAQKARDDAWDAYNKAWDAANAQHKEWANLSKNYDKLHAEWEQRKNQADSLACGAPQDPGAEPEVPTEPTQPVREDYETDADYQAAMSSYKTALATYQAKKAAHDKWQQLYDQFLDDTEAYKAYQDALAQLGEEPQPAGAEPEYPEAPDDTALASAVESAQEGVTTASQGVQKAKEAYDEAVELAEKRQVKAPSAGNIVALGAKVGEAIGGASGGSSEASSGPLAQISDVKQMSVGIEVNEIDILNVKKGQKAKATFSAVSGVEVDAKVSEVATIATGGGDGGGIVTFHVGLVIPKPDAKLREGMTANVKIYTVDIKDALVIPTSALSEGSDGMTVEVVIDQETLQTEVRPVKVGARSSSEAVIEEGLEEGETVLLTGGLMDEYDMGF